MIVSEGATRDGEAAVAAYERLRSHVLAGAGAGSPVGWTLFVREGIAAWMARSSAGSPSIGPGADRERLGATAQLAGEIQGAVVQVLASMALAGRGEMSS